MTKPNPKEQIYAQRIYLGCDPELFLTQHNKVIGSERVIPDAGMVAVANGLTDKIVQDGIQVELNPAPRYCRQELGCEIALAFRKLKEHLANMDNVKVSFRQVVEVDQAELDSLSEKARMLGCAPSHNFYDKKAAVTVDPAKYNKRSAGGHIHIGLKTSYPALMPIRERLAPLLDIILGNTAVMLDRDPNAAERRKVYGRAGEFRLPVHGFEYRTLSNFWLRSYELTCLVLGLTRLATACLAAEMGVMYDIRTSALLKYPAEKELLSLVDLQAIRTAINNNDVALAKENYAKIKPFLLQHIPRQDNGLDAARLDTFDHFVKRVDEKGLEYWFPKDPFDAWCGMTSNYNKLKGWEYFLDNTVATDMLSNEGNTQ